MRSILFVLALCASGCDSQAPEPPPPAPKPVAPMYGIRTMQLSETGTSHITYESRHSTGSIEIKPGIRIGYAVGHKDTIKKMADWDSVGNISVMALQGAKAALAVPESCSFMSM